MNQRELRRALSPGKMESAWDEILSSWSAGGPEEMAEVRTFVAREYENLQQALMDVDDAAERASLLTHYFVRLKAQWMTLNTQIGYQMVAGRHNEKLFYQNSLLSTLIGAIEPFVEPAIAGRLGAILSDPSGEIKAAVREEAAHLTLADVAAAIAESGTEPTAREEELLSSVRGLSDTIASLKMDVASLQAENERLDEALAEEQSQAPVLAFSAGDADLYLNGHAPPASAGSPAPDAARLREALDALRREAAVQKAQLETVLLEAGADSPAAAVALLRERSDRLRAAEREAEQAAAERETLRSTLGGEGRPEEAVEQVRKLRSSLEQLENESGPAILLREQLSREFGTSDPVQVMARIREAREQALGLRQRAEAHESERQYLAREIGRTAPEQIVALLRDFHDGINALRAERAQWEADRAALAEAAGTADIREVAEQIVRMRAELETLSGVADLLSNMDEALAAVG